VIDLELPFEVFARVFAVPGQELGEAASHTAGRLEQPFAIRVLAHRFEQRTHGARRLLDIEHQRLVRGLDDSRFVGHVGALSGRTSSWCVRT
jgi:hypothetical protein